MSEFPKMMVHPAAQRGTTKRIAGSEVFRPDGSVKFADYQGTPDRFPPVEVADSNEEEQYRAKGYLPFGEQPKGAIHFVEYPKMMVHPDFVAEVPACVAVTTVDGRLVSPAIPGVPAKFPPVAVKDIQDEEAWTKKGYAPAGVSDPVAVQAAISSPYDPDRVKSEYPKMVDGVLVEDPSAPGGVVEYPKWIGDKLVHSREEELVLRPSTPEDKATAAKAAKDRAAAAKAKAEAEMAAAEAELAALEQPAPETIPVKKKEQLSLRK